jgi:hypothetical protein
MRCMKERNAHGCILLTPMELLVVVALQFVL